MLALHLPLAPPQAARVAGDLLGTIKDPQLLLSHLNGNFSTNQAPRHTVAVGGDFHTGIAMYPT